MNFGEYIRKLRNDIKLSQRDLSEKSGVSNAEISRVESGERKNPSPLVLKAIAPHLGVPYEELLQKAGYMEEVIDHQGFTENIFRDEEGNLVDIVKKAKAMYEKSSNWAKVAFRVADENLTEAEVEIIRRQTETLLEEFLKNKNK